MIRLRKLERGYVTLEMDSSAVTHLANALYEFHKTDNRYKAKREEVELMVIRDMMKGMIEPYTVRELNAYHESVINEEVTAYE